MKTFRFSIGPMQNTSNGAINWRNLWTKFRIRWRNM